MQGSCDLEVMCGTGQNVILMVIQKGKIQCVALLNHLSKCYLQQVVATPLWSPLPCLPLLLTVIGKAHLGHGCIEETGRSLALTPFLGNWGEGSDRAGLCVCWMQMQHIEGEADHPSWEKQCPGQEGRGDLALVWTSGWCRKECCYGQWYTLQHREHCKVMQTSQLVIFNYLSQFACSCLCLVITASHTLLFWRSQWFWSLTLPLKA